MPHIAINGLGRMGKLLVRRLTDEGLAKHIVLLNDKAGDPATHAHLLEFDTVHGRWPAAIGARDDTLVVGERRMRVTQSATLAGLPLAELGIDLAIDCTGACKTPGKLQPYYNAGVRKLLVSAPVPPAGHSHHCRTRNRRNSLGHQWRQLRV